MFPPFVSGADLTIPKNSHRLITLLVFQRVERNLGIRPVALSTRFSPNWCRYGGMKSRVSAAFFPTFSRHEVWAGHFLRAQLFCRVLIGLNRWHQGDANVPCGLALSQVAQHLIVVCLPLCWFSWICIVHMTRGVLGLPCVGSGQVSFGCAVFLPFEVAHTIAATQMQLGWAESLGQFGV